jgi:penicillin-binding protein 2
MERISRLRATTLLLLFFLILAFFIYTMYDLQVIETGGVIDNTTTFTTITRVKAARGDILDRNGNKLVGNRASYDLVLNHYVLLSASGTNMHLYNLVKTCEETGITYTDHFPVSAQKPYVYTLDQYNSTWKSHFQVFLEYQGGLDSDITAPLLLEKLREIYDIPAE